LHIKSLAEQGFFLRASFVPLHPGITAEQCQRQPRRTVYQAQQEKELYSHPEHKPDINDAGLPEDNDDLLNKLVKRHEDKSHGNQSGNNDHGPDQRQANHTSSLLGYLSVPEKALVLFTISYSCCHILVTKKLSNLSLLPYYVKAAK
jgi:hypothetical protein